MHGVWRQVRPLDPCEMTDILGWAAAAINRRTWLSVTASIPCYLSSNITVRMHIITLIIRRFVSFSSDNITQRNPQQRLINAYTIKHTLSFSSYWINSSKIHNNRLINVHHKAHSFSSHYIHNVHDKRNTEFQFLLNKCIGDDTRSPRSPNRKLH